MKNAIIFALLFLVAILAFGTRNEAQAVIEDTTVHHAKWIRLRAGIDTGSLSATAIFQRDHRRGATPAYSHPLGRRLALGGFATDVQPSTLPQPTSAASTNPPAKQADWPICVTVRSLPLLRTPHGRVDYRQGVPANDRGVS